MIPNDYLIPAIIVRGAAVWFGLGNVSWSAITITVLALFSLYLRQAAQRLLELFLNQSNTEAFFTNILGVFGGGLTLIFGLSLLRVALMDPTHPLR